MKIRERHLGIHLARLIKQFPAIWLTGPRQSGKTTLVKSIYKNYRYVSFEDIDMRNFARNDPRGFLRQFSNKVILDEVQKCPDILSYLQTHMDEQGKPGQYVLTGSHQFQLARNISQSLAGRVAVVTLLPFSTSERYDLSSSAIDGVKAAKNFLLPRRYDVENILFKGMYPAIHDRKADPASWLSSYYSTYLERDVREITSVHNQHQFDTFVRLCAARSGSILNYSGISNECGASVPTVKGWLSILQLSGLVKLIPPYFQNYSKRLIKSPKLYFLDSGLLCYLLRITSAEQLSFHPLKGPIFETFIVSEIIKSFYHKNMEPPVYFWRDNKGREIDLLLDFGTTQWPVEIKVSETVNPAFFKTILWWLNLPGNKNEHGSVIYGGHEDQNREPVNVRSWRRPF